MLNITPPNFCFSNYTALRRPGGGGWAGRGVCFLQRRIYASRCQLRAWPWGGGGGPAGGVRSWTGVCFLSLSPPTSGLAQRGCSAGGCWTGSLLSTPLAADFGPAPEGAAYSRHFICFPCRPLLRARLGGDGEGAYGQRVCRGGPEKRGTGATTTFPSFRNHSDLTGSQPIDQDSLACLAWLALWPSWRDTGACFARRAWVPSPCHADRLPGLLLSAGWMALQTPHPGLVCWAAQLAQSSPSTPGTHSPTQSFTHWPLDVRPRYALSLVSTPSKTVDRTPTWWDGEGLLLYGVSWTCLVASVGAGWVNKEYTKCRSTLLIWIWNLAFCQGMPLFCLLYNMEMVLPSTLVVAVRSSLHCIARYRQPGDTVTAWKFCCPLFFIFCLP